MDIEFDGGIWYWRGPAPFFFVSVPEKESGYIKLISQIVTYGWGVIPVQVTIGDTVWKTSLFPKDGCYLAPIKDKVRKAENLSPGDTVTVCG